MKSLRVKIFTALIVLFILMVGGGSFYLHKKINPKALSKQIVKSIESKYPNIKVKLGKLKVNLGVTTKLELSTIQFKNIGSKVPSEISDVKKVVVNIPIFNILTGGGTIKVEIESPKVNYLAKNNTSNWEEALISHEGPSPVGDGKAPKSKEKKLPVFFANSQINASFTNLAIAHMTEDMKESLYAFDSIQLKDIGVKRPMAFKLTSIVKLEKEKKISLKLGSIGEFSLKDFLDNQNIRTKALTKITEVTVDEKALPMEELVVDSNILFRNDKTGRVDVEFKSEELLKAKAQLLVLKGITTVKIENLDLSVAKLLGLLDIKPEGLQSNESWLSLKGEVKVGDKGQLSPNL